MSNDPYNPWLEDAPLDAAMIEAYKAEWHKYGFPDVERGRDTDVLDNPTFQGTPEQELWNAVLQMAHADLWRRVPPHAQYRYEDAKVRKVKDEITQWFRSGDDGEGSFLWICLQLGLEPSYVRRMAFSTPPKPDAWSRRRAEEVAA